MLSEEKCEKKISPLSLSTHYLFHFFLYFSHLSLTFLYTKHFSSFLLLSVILTRFKDFKLFYKCTISLNNIIIIKVLLRGFNLIDHKEKGNHYVGTPKKNIIQKIKESTYHAALYQELAKKSRSVRLKSVNLNPDPHGLNLDIS